MFLIVYLLIGAAIAVYMYRLKDEISLFEILAWFLMYPILFLTVFLLMPIKRTKNLNDTNIISNKLCRQKRREKRRAKRIKI